MQRRDCLMWAWAGAATTLLGGCATGPRVITLGPAELNQLLARTFPLQRRLLEVLDVRLSVPHLRLLPERNRLAMELVLSTQERLLGSAAQGLLAFDSALRYEPQDASVRLTQVRVQQLRLEPLAAPPSAPAGPAQRLGLSLAERVLEDLSIYQLNAERQASLRQLGLQPGAVTVTSRGVEITLARSTD